jgi:hypothetical protein
MMTEELTVAPARVGRDTRTLSRVVAAVLMPIGPACVAVIRLVIPDDSAPAGDPVAELAALRLVHTFGIPAMFTLLPGIYAALHLTRRYRPVFTAWVAAFLVPAYLGMAALGAVDYFTLAAAEAGLDAQTTAQVTDRLWSLTIIPTVVFVVGHIVGTVLLGLVVLSSRLTPAWVAVLLMVSQPLHLVAIVTGQPLLDLAAWGATALGMTFLAVRVWTTPNAEWALPPYPRAPRLRSGHRAAGA